MKRRITKAEFDALSDALKQIYVQDGDGYKLPLVDDDDPAELRRARDREKQAAKDAKAALETANAELEKLRGPAHKDIATLEKSWQEKLTARETELTTQIEGLKKSLNATLVDHATATIAGSITAKPENASVMAPHIKNRLEVVFDGDTPTVKVKDKQGKLSAMSLAELGKEFQTDPVFATVVVVSKATGAGGTRVSTQAGSGSGADGTKKLADMTSAERTELLRSDPAEFKRLTEAAKAERFTPKIHTVSR
jgi:hypothetical protein